MEEGREEKEGRREGETDKDEGEGRGMEERGGVGKGRGGGGGGVKGHGKKDTRYAETTGERELSTLNLEKASGRGDGRVGSYKSGSFPKQIS